MNDLTEAEYDALDEYYTKNPPKLDPAKNRIKDRSFHVVSLDGLSAAYLRAKAQADRKTPAEIIGELIRKEIGRAAVL
jgi:hypothetical protein